MEDIHGEPKTDINGIQGLSCPDIAMPIWTTDSLTAWAQQGIVGRYVTTIF